MNTLSPIEYSNIIPSYITGHGQKDTHSVTLNDGRRNPRKSAGTPYETITGEQIVPMVADPPSVPKEQAQWFIPSSYAEHDGRNHEAQAHKGA